MNVLAIETSTELCSIALLLGDELLVEEVNAPNQHAERLAPMIAGLLARAGITPGQMDAFAFGQGPGSFTGIRIACGVTQGLALGSDRPIVAVPSQLALAEQAGSSRVVVGLDARMGETYLAAYVRRDRDWEAQIDPCLVPAGALPALDGHGWVASGSGFDAFEWLRSGYSDRISRRIEGELPRAGAVARIAARRLARGEVLAPDEAAPLYLREKVAMTTEERRVRN